MSIIPDNYYNNLSCYEEFVIKTNLLGLDVSDKEVLEYLYKADDYYCLFTDRMIFLDKNGNKVENIKKVNGDFSCSGTNITSLEGAPKEVGGGFYCTETKITQEQLNAYMEFLKNQTPDHIDETGHYKP